MLINKALQGVVDYAHQRLILFIINNWGHIKGYWPAKHAPHTRQKQQYTGKNKHACTTKLNTEANKGTIHLSKRK